MILNGLRVLDLTHVVSGPTVTQILADFGAEVIKIEVPPRGDLFRNTEGLGPSFFLAINRGKKSVMIDLRKEAGFQLLLRLAAISDVIVENLSPDAVKKLGLEYESFRKVNPKIVYCRIASFGKGPYENVPAWDPVLQAAAGIMSVTGMPPDNYVRAGISLIDMSTAFHAVIGILVALLKRENTGQGNFIEASMFDAALYYMSYWIAYYDLYGKNPLPLGTTHVFASPYGLFKVKDGSVYVAVSNDDYWKKFCKAFDFKELASNANYSTNKQRVDHKNELESYVSKKFEDFSLDYVLARLVTEGIPHAALNRVSDLVSEPHAMSRGIIAEYTSPGEKLKYRTVVNPLTLDGVRHYTTLAPPEPGEHTDTTLRELLGLSDTEIQSLRAVGVIA